MGCPGPVTQVQPSNRSSRQNRAASVEPPRPSDQDRVIKAEPPRPNSQDRGARAELPGPGVLAGSAASALSPGPSHGHPSPPMASRQAANDRRGSRELQGSRPGAATRQPISGNGLPHPVSTWKRYAVDPWASVQRWRRQPWRHPPHRRHPLPPGPGSGPSAGPCWSGSMTGSAASWRP